MRLLFEKYSILIWFFFIAGFVTVAVMVLTSFDVPSHVATLYARLIIHENY